ncbi:MAG TPA: heavy metal translocating P-type ATPase, partial [Terracidiphilus sp.]
MPIVGMTCAACQHHVEEALRSAKGVSSARVDLMAHTAEVVFDPAMAPRQSLVEAVRSAGYDAVLPAAGAASAPATHDHGAPDTAKAYATIAGGALVMLLSMPLSDKMNWFDRLLMHVLPPLYAIPPSLLRWVLLLATGILMMWAGRSIFSSAWRGLQHGSTNMNTLVSLGTGTAFLYSAYATLLPAPGRAVYFDAVLLILGFLLLGKTLEAMAKKRALSALDALSRLRPLTVRRVVNGKETEVPLDEVKPGDMVVVMPGERFPVDGEIVEGRTSVDESMLTGESTPLDRGPGGKVLAGSLNYDGVVSVRANSLGADTVLEQIARMVQQAQSSRAPMERLADRASAIFVPVVLGLSATTFIVWIFATHSLQLALASTVAVLVIACPCAMG